MSKVLNFVKEVESEASKYSNHPGNELDAEQKYLYLKGLALIAFADDFINDAEKKYLETLLLSFSLPKASINVLLEFANEPDKDVYLDMIEFLKSSTIRYNFIIDALLLAHKDGEFHNDEKELLDNFYEAIKITADEIQEINDIFLALQKRESKTILKVMRRNGVIPKDHFSFMFDFYKIDIKKIEEEENETIKNLLELNFVKIEEWL